jgi:hypothetical protein
MNDELQNLLHRWREGSLTADEMRTLTALLAKPEARQALRRDWFLEAALPEALAASAVIVRTPQPSLAAKLRGWIAGWLIAFAPRVSREEDAALCALRLWARASFAALALGLITASWLVWPQREEFAADVDADSEPAFLAQIMIETHLPDSP